MKLILKASRGHLVKKTITNTKGKKQVVWVNVHKESGRRKKNGDSTGTNKMAAEDMIRELTNAGIGKDQYAKDPDNITHKEAASAHSMFSAEIKEAKATKGTTANKEASKK